MYPYIDSLISISLHLRAYPLSTQFRSQKFPFYLHIRAHPLSKNVHSWRHVTRALHNNRDVLGITINRGWKNPKWQQISIEPLIQTTTARNPIPAIDPRLNFWFSSSCVAGRSESSGGKRRNDAHLSDFHRRDAADVTDTLVDNRGQCPTRHPRVTVQQPLHVCIVVVEDLFVFWIIRDRREIGLLIGNCYA
mgnify:CR=1 FL=1